jgi:DNA-binding transcriptional LysR family regulator
MNLRQIEVFHAVMEAGTVTGAAKLLNVSQPAITAMLRHTEDQLRFRLFERVRGRLEPTSEARALFAETARVFEDVRTVRRLVEDLREARAGTLSVVTIPILGEALIPRVVASLLTARPKVKVRFQVRPRREMLDLVASRSVDLGVGFLSAAHAGLRIAPLAAGRLVCIVPPTSALAARDGVCARDLQGETVIGYTERQGLSQVIARAFEDARVAVEPAIEVGLVANAWALVNEGVGVALVDEHSGLHALFPNVVRLPFRPEVPVGLELLVPEDKPSSILAQEFVRHLVRVAQGAGALAGPPPAPGLSPKGEAEGVSPAAVQTG